jgi:hypothetical protein
MADFMRDLPLSWRPRDDEHTVTSDWREALADVLDAAAAALDAARTARAGAAMTDAAGPATSELDRLVEPLIAAATPRHGLFEAPAAPPRPTDLRDLARATRSGRKVSVRTLSRGVAAYLSLARELGATPVLAHRTSGAVALYLAATAHTPIRAVISGHALHATDAGWTFGRGPTLEAEAVPMVEFLAGQSLVAPRAAPAH